MEGFLEIPTPQLISCFKDSVIYVAENKCGICVDLREIRACILWSKSTVL